MKRSKKWAAWLATGALVANLVVPMGAGAMPIRLPEPRPAGDPDQPNPGAGPSSLRTTVYLEVGAVLHGQFVMFRVPLGVFASWWRARS